MKYIKNKRNLYVLFAFVLTFSAIGLNDLWEKIKKEEKREQIITTRTLIKKNLNEAFKFSKKTFPKKIELKEEQVSIKYSFDEDLTKYIKRILKRYRSDYSSVIVIDNETGFILSAVGYERVGNQFNITLPFSSTHPSASLFKIVTTADLLEKSDVTKDSIFKFRGRGTTLYKYQLKDKKSRWQRRQTFERAFAYSNNVIFGKAAIKNSTGERLYDMAADFGFNEKLMEEVSLSKSVFEMPGTDYELAEKASGFNKKTMISPIHAAVMASVVANDGVLNYPRVVTEINDNVSNKVIWSPQHRTKRVLEVPTARELQELMVATVKRGTARGSYRRLSRKLRNGLEIGGKTGSITGGVPFGKRDWFTSFAVPVNKSHGKGISVAVMNINLEKWYVKSSYLSRKIMEYYFKKINPLNDNVTETKKNESGKDT